MTSLNIHLFKINLMNTPPPQVNFFYKRNKKLEFLFFYKRNIKTTGLH
jgi:hypothetical protein